MMPYFMGIFSKNRMVVAMYN